MSRRTKETETPVRPDGMPIADKFFDLGDVEVYVGGVRFYQVNSLSYRKVTQEIGRAMRAPRKAPR